MYNGAAAKASPLPLRQNRPPGFRPGHHVVSMIESWKPVLTALVLPPVPWLVLALLGAWQQARRPRLARALVVAAVVLLWLSCCSAVGRWIERHWLDETAPLAAAQIEGLRERVAKDASKIAIVALGGGVQANAPELGAPDLADRSLMRLRYAARLSRQTGAALGFSGGTGWAQRAGRPDAAEARVAERIAREEYGVSMRWIEDRSRDTRENAALVVPMLADTGVREIVLVTDAWHMRRSLRAFEGEASARGIRVLAAPTGFPDEDSSWLDWLPSSDGHVQVRQTLRELIGYAMGR